jgi:glycopeptide antibiotics resistance protein
VLNGVVVYPFAVVIAVLVGWRAARGGLPAFVVAMRVLFVLYLGWVVAATLFPLPIRAGVLSLESAGRSVSVEFMPLASIRETLRDGSRFAQVWIIGGNIFTLAPFGFLLPFSAPRLATWGRMALAALLFPLLIELSQLAISLLLGYSYRLTEVDDVILNAVGILLGFCAYVVARRHVSAPASPARVQKRRRG